MLLLRYNDLKMVSLCIPMRIWCDLKLNLRINYLSLKFIITMAITGKERCSQIVSLICKIWGRCVKLLENLSLPQLSLQFFILICFLFLWSIWVPSKMFFVCLTFGFFCFLVFLVPLLDAIQKKWQKRKNIPTF